VYRQYGAIDGESIPLTTISVATNGRELSNSLRQLKEGYVRCIANDVLRNDYPGRVGHTDAYYLLRIKAHLNVLFEQALDSTLDAALSR
jgi:avirulence protein